MILKFNNLQETKRNQKCINENKPFSWLCPLKWYYFNLYRVWSQILIRFWHIFAIQNVTNWLTKNNRFKIVFIIKMHLRRGKNWVEIMRSFLFFWIIWHDADILVWLDWMFVNIWWARVLTWNLWSAQNSGKLMKFCLNPKFVGVQTLSFSYFSNFSMNLHLHVLKREK